MFAMIVLAIAAPVPTENKGAADWPAALKAREFKFDGERSGARNCAAAARKAGAAVEISGDGELGRSVDIKVSIKDGKPVDVLGHSGSAFVVRDGVLFFADFSPYSNGCKLTAHDLKTGKQAWSKPVEGLGPIAHFKYNNRISLAIEKHPTTDAWGVVVTGWESAGRYIEVLDPATGKMLANRKYEAK